MYGSFCYRWLVENFTAAKNVVPPIPHHVSHNVGLTPFTNLSSGWKDNWKVTYPVDGGSSVLRSFNPYPTALPYGNGMVLHFYQQQDSSTTNTVHKVINKGLKAYV